MKKKILALAIIVIFTLSTILTIIVFATNSEAYIPSTATLLEVNESIEYCKTEQNKLHTLANHARDYGFSETSFVISKIKEEWLYWEQHVQNLTIKQQEFIIIENQRIAEEEAARKKQEEEAKWAQKAAEYPTATYIWRHLKAQGYNDYVCAGILGNMMAETGGQTLNIKWNIYGNGYYGICQWNKAYRAVWGTSLENQCNFLSQTIAYEFNTYGSNYSKGFNYNSFLNMTNYKEAAIAFAKCYERCGSAHYHIRAVNAEKAYNYFVN
jgi:hypothetical protein